MSARLFREKSKGLEASGTTLRNSRLVLLGNKILNRYSAKPKPPPHQPSLELHPPEGHLYLLSQQRNTGSMPAPSFLDQFQVDSKKVLTVHHFLPEFQFHGCRTCSSGKATPLETGNY